MPAGKVYLLGICGTFMAGLAGIARELGYFVQGCDKAAWPPMSEQLVAHNIGLDQPCSASSLDGYDVYIVGNAMCRGDESVEALLTRRIPIYSGPQWLYEQVLQYRRVLCVAGTHGKNNDSFYARMGVGVCWYATGVSNRWRADQLWYFCTLGTIRFVRYRRRRVRHCFFLIRDRSSSTIARKYW